MKKNFNGKFLLSSLLLMIGLLIQNPSQAQRKRVTRIDCDGVPVRVGFDISGFHGVETKKIIDVVLIPSDEEKVEVEMWPAFQEFLKVEKKNGVLCFDLRSMERLETTGTCHLTAYVHFTDLRSIAASEAADVSMKGVYDAGGNAEMLNMQTTGSADVRMGDFSVLRFVGTSSGASSLKIRVTDSFRAEASGSAEVYVAGSPKTTDFSTSGASAIKIR